MIAWIIIGVLLGIFVLLFCAPIRVRIQYGAELHICAKFWFFTVFKMPKKKKLSLKKYTYAAHQKRLAANAEREAEKAKKEAEKKEAKKRKKEEKKSNPPKTKKVLNVKEALFIVVDVLKLLVKRFLHCFRIDVAKIHITVGGGNAADTATTYGVICQGVCYVCELLNKIADIHADKNTDIAVDANFLAGKTTADIDICITTRLYKPVGLALRVAFRALKDYLKHPLFRTVPVNGAADANVDDGTSAPKETDAPREQSK